MLLSMKDRQKINQSRTQPKLIEGTLNAHKNLDALFIPEAQPFLQMSLDFMVFQQENARPHTAQLVKLFFREINITKTPFPANSPDLNPIEYRSEYMMQKIRAKNPRKLAYSFVDV